jgi:uncharacterized protein DUF4350
MESLKISGFLVARSILASLVVALIIFILLVLLAPDAVPFSSNNYGWNGIEQVSAHYTITPVSSLVGLQPERSVLLMLQPTVNYSQGDASAVKQFARGGGVVLVAGSSSLVNRLLQSIGAGVLVQSQFAINDPAFNWRSSDFPTVLVLPNTAQQFRFLTGVNGIALDSPSPLKVEAGSKVQVLAISSPLSHEGSRANESPLIGLLGGSPPVATGSFPTVVAERIGNGSLLIIGDSQFLTNSVWTLADNQVLARNLMANSSVYLDTSHWQPNTGEGVKAALGSAYALFSGVPLRYMLVALFVGASIVILPSFTELRGEGKVESRRLMPAQRTFNKEVIERVRKDREKYGVQSE